jgi:RNA polymerase sigma factor (sigma-70 family)
MEHKTNYPSGRGHYSGVIDSLYSELDEVRALGFETVTRIVDDPMHRWMVQHIRAPDESTREEWAQETYIRFAAAIHKHSISYECDLIGWFCVTARNIACEYSRKAKLINDAQGIEEFEEQGYGLVWALGNDDDCQGDIGGDESHPPFEQRKQAMLEELNILMLQLSEMEQAIISESLKGRNATEISKIVGIRPDLVRQKKKRAIEKLIKLKEGQ